MNRILAIFCLIFISLDFTFAGDSVVSSHKEFIAKQEQLLGQNAIENCRSLTKAYPGLSKDEKESFLLEAGLTEEALISLQAWLELDWKMEGRHQLPLSNSTISIPNGYALVTGSDAVARYDIEGEPADEFLEAYVCDINSFESSVVFQNIKTGYISIDDWKEIDHKELLKGIIQNIEEENKERRKRKSADLHVIGWIQKPKLDQDTKTVYWAIEVNSGDSETLVNSVAIRLGREGYEQITWITSRSSYGPFGGLLDTMLRAHSFNIGYRYEDYRTGDKLADYGIATLVATTLGPKVVKADYKAMSVIAIDGLLFVGGVAFWYKFRNFIKRSVAEFFCEIRNHFRRSAAAFFYKLRNLFRRNKYIS